MKLSTINQIIERLVVYEAKNGEKSTPQESKQRINGACIILKTAMICEQSGIEEAMAYHEGTHSEDEYMDWLTFVVKPEDEE